MRNHSTLPTQVTQPLPLPQGVSNSAIGGSSLQPLPISRSYVGAASLSPGISSGTLATVMVTAAASYSVNSTAPCSAATTFKDLAVLPQPIKAHASKRPHPTTEAVQLGSITADRDGVPLLRTAALVNQKLKELAKAGHLAGLPESFTVRLRIDASGAVVSVLFDRPCEKPGQVLEVHLLAWRFAT